MVKYIKSDLQFILEQIKIAEAHAAGQPLYGPGGLIPTYNLSWGLRTVDGSYNNLLNPNWGSSDEPFPERLGTDFRTLFIDADPRPDVVNIQPMTYIPGVDNDGPTMTIPTPGGPVTIGDRAGPGDVIDPQVRIISNLIVDQTLSNPSAILTALQRAGVDDPGMLITASIANAYQPVKPLFDALSATQRVYANAAAAAAASPNNAALQQAAAEALANVEAARATLEGSEGYAPLVTLLADNGIELDGINIVITNTAPDEGLSAPFNSWFTLFGQFFDHGLDLVGKGGSGTVMIPLMPDDPLYVEGSTTNFMVLTRATVGPGPDGIMVDNPSTAVDESADNTRPVNTTTAFVDQNQTYTSHASHQVFLREYAMDASGRPVATGELIQGLQGGMATWKDLKAQAADMLGIQLLDSDVGNIPLLLTDPYGEFIRGANGFVQIMTTTGLVEANPADNGGLGTLLPPNTLRTGHAFLADIAHSAVPEGLADGDIEIGLENPGNEPGIYDNELLDAHYVAGDGRANENIGLTAVHHVFHSEHNRLAQHTKVTALETKDLAFINEWLLVDLTQAQVDALPAVLPTDPVALDTFLNGFTWDGERIFQAAKFGTEMQYQHLVFEEFARKIQPNINVFLVPDGFDVTIDPSIVAEFAHVVYRFGHSMLTESIDRFDPNFDANHIGLIEGFLNPIQFENNGGVTGVDAEISAGAIIRGMTRQPGNQIDEFVTSALRNNLLGLPLDLATINLARGRDTGVPSLNAARANFYAATDENSLLKPYESWVDFAGHLKNEASIINFIAAYGTHSLITSQTTLAGMRDAALTIITGVSVGGLEVPPDAVDFLNATGDYAGGSLGGLNNVDLWIGGLAEEIMPFGGMLGSTFNFVFEIQMESLQNGDRFYYLQRLDGLHLFGEMEGNSFAAMIMRNTDATHLPSDVFSTPGLILEVDRTRQYNPGLGETAGADGILEDDPNTAVNEAADNLGIDPVGGGLLTPHVVRNNPATAGPDTNYLRYSGDEHVLLGGTDNADTIIASIGDDTIFGDGGNDNLEGGFGNDIINGGDGDDIIRDAGGDDNIKGGNGNDAIHAGPGLDLVLGGAGQDFVILGTDMGSEIFGGEGDDFMLGNKNAERILGNEGNDWIETGTFDGAPGDNFDEIFARDEIDGHDVFLGDGGFDEFIGEGGDDIFVGSPGRGKMAGMSGFDWATYKNNAQGVNADLSIPIVFDEAPTLPQNAALDEFESVQGLSGTRFNDVLSGSNEDAASLLPLSQGGGTGYLGSALDAQGIAMISGLQAVVGAGVTSFAAGDIILGGDGSDIIQGNGGDDIIDGDKWLDVQIGVFALGDTNHTGTPLRLVNSMKEFTADVFAGLINPGQLSIVRTIRTDTTAGDIDTARYVGLRGEYAFSATADGQVIVTHAVDNAVDGSDRLRNIERVQFADGSALNIIVGTPYNDNGAPTQGAPPFNQPVLNGTAQDDLILGLAGTDVLNGGAGNDILVGGAGASTAVNTYADNFQTGSNSNNDGSSNFASNWAEAGDSGGTTAGQIRIDDGNNVLRFYGGTPAPNFDGAQITRTMNLATATSAVITYTANPDGLDAGESVQVQFAANGTTFVTLQTITGDGGATPYSHTITGPFAANAAIRFVTSAINAAGEGVSIDDLVISATVPAANTGVDTLNGGLGDDTYSFVRGDGNDVINEAVNATSGGTADRISILAPTTGIDPLTDLPIQTISGLSAFDNNTGTNNGDLVINYSLPDGAASVAQTITVAGHFNGNTAGTGVERINFNSATYAGYALGADDYVISRADTNNNRTIDLSASTVNNFVAGENGTSDVITGGQVNDLIFGGSGNNDLVGGLGDDLLVGGVGNDDLDARLNAAGDDFEGAFDVDTLIGGDGNDTYGVDDVADVVVEAANQGTDTVQTFLTALSIETVANVENLSYLGADAGQFVGTGNALNNVITGGDLADTLSGLAGNDTLQGGLGADTMTGGDGNDVYFVDEAGDVVVETSALVTDIDRVESDIDYTLGANLENLDLNNNAEIGRGNALNNVINGNGAANQLFGGAGNDTLNGDDGNDLLDGGAGNDTLNGGDDSDTIIGGDGNDTIDVGGGVNTIIYNSINFGADVINSFDAAGGTPQTQDRIDLSGLGITAANFATRVTIAAAGGNTLVTVRDAALASIGTIQINGVTSPNITVTDFTLATAPVAPPINGTAAANTLNGTANADTINGLGGNDVLNGLGNNDVLNGGEGADTLNGGDGNDTLTGGTSAAAVNNADNFDTASQGNSNGTTAWGPDWVESGDSGGVTTGQIRIDAGNNNVLQFIGGAGNDFNGAQIQRSVDLLGATGATLNYTFAPTALDGGADNDSVTVFFSRDGATFVQVDVINSTTAGATRNIDLNLFGSGPFTSNAAVRFVASSLEAGDSVNVDNLSINATGSFGVDTVNGDAGDDTIAWNANAATPTDGRDIVNGGLEGAVGDIFVVTGNASAETYNVYTRTAWLAVAGNLAANLNVNTEIVVTRNGSNNASVIAELNEIEEIRINGVDPAAATGSAGGDTFNIIGDFSGTSLRLNTITIDGSSADDVIDITGLASDHRVVFTSNGGADTIRGEKRSQDVVNVTEGGTLNDTRVTSGANDPDPEDDHDDDHDTDHGHDDEEEAEDVVLTGGSGDDKLSGGSSADTIKGGSGDDTLKGRSGNDLLEGGSGDDVLSGGSDNDTLKGGSGDDELNGGSGDDVLDGGSGDDTLTGGSGADVFRFGAGDSITDFEAGDRIDLSGEGVTAANFAQKVTLVQKGDDAWLKIGSSKMLLSGVDVDDLDAADFMFSDASSSADEAAAAESQAQTLMQQHAIEALDAANGVPFGASDSSADKAVNAYERLDMLDASYCT